MSTKSISLDDSSRIAPDLVFRNPDGEAVLLNLETGLYFGLNESGTRMWDLLQEHGSLRKVFDQMLLGHDVTPEALEGDLCQLAAELCEKELLVAAHAT
jgi:hypothetical protein